MMPRLVTIWHAVYILLITACMLIVSWPIWAKLIFMAITGIIAARMERAEADLRKSETELEKALELAYQQGDISALEARAKLRAMQWL